MPLGVREILLVIRAQNVSSGVLRGLVGDFTNLDNAAKKAAQRQIQTGSALMAVGTAVGAVGAAGLLFLGKATSAAVDYGRQVALTKTQTYGLKVSLDQLSQAGLDVARNIAVPLDQIQAGLYDIFSSMDVNLTQAKFLLTNFSKEAVAGQVDLSTAERATIGIMNAYRMKVTDVTKVQDIMFNLVKFGVGTYADFANSIGRVTGPAVRANQSFSQTAALMAFITRNGLSAANASASIGRALDAVGKSRAKIQDIGKTVQEALGPAVAAKLGFTAKSMIQVTDSSGKLLPVNEIMTKLGTSLKNLNPTQLNDVLTAMFKGTGGSIQAMRFFDIAVKNYGQLNQMVKNMANSKGALKAAYDTMAQTPAMKIQLLSNQFKAFMIVLGQQLLPILGKVAGALSKFFGWLGSLPKSTIKIIAIVLGVISVLALLAGAVMTVVGVWLVFSAVLAATEIALAPILLTVGLVIAAVAALAIAAYLIYKHWGPISTWFHNMWFAMWKWIDHVWQLVWKTINGVWIKIKNLFNTIMKWISTNFDKWWLTHGLALQAVWSNTWSAITNIFTAAWSLITGYMKTALAAIEAMIKIIWGQIQLIFKSGWDVIVGIFRVAWAIIAAGFKVWWAVITAVTKVAWASIQAIMKIAWDTIVAMFSIFLDVMTGHWHTALVDIQNLGKQIWNAIKNFVIAVWNAMRSAAVPIWNALTSGFFNAWHAIYTSTQQVWNNIKGFLGTVWNAIKSGASSFVSGLGQIWNGLENVFKIPVNFLIGTVYDNGIRALWNTVMGAIGLGHLNLPAVKTLAGGGRLKGYGGGDRIPALLEAGETVIDKHRTRQYASIFRAMGVPGFQGGGVAFMKTGISSNPTGGPTIPGGGVLHNIGHAITSVGSDIFHLGGAAGKMALAAMTGNQTAFVNALISAFPGAKGVAGNLAAMIATLPIAMAKDAVKSVWNKISGAGSNVKYKAGAGVQQWKPDVLKALAMLGLPLSLANNVLYQMQTESGGNPGAINLWDSNAAAGDPSRGLMQVIGSTFAAYHVPGTSLNILDPLANIAAALNYAMHRYGPTLMSGGMGIGSGHGYAGGTSGARRGWAWVGEYGPELVNFLGGEVVVPHGGYATGAGVRSAEIAKYLAEIVNYERLAAKAKTAAQRNLYYADINLLRARIAKLEAGTPPKPPKPTKIPRAEINAGLSLFASYVQSGPLSLSKMQSLQTQYLKDIAKYYTGGALRAREALVERQTTAMENADKKLAALQATAKAASAYAASVTSNLSGYAALSNFIPTAGTPVAGQSATIYAGVQSKLAQLKRFAAVLGQLKKAGVSAAIIQQIVAMGPDDGYNFAQALLQGPLVYRQELNTAVAQIGAVTAATGRAAAAAVYGQAAVDGFKSQEAALTKIMKNLGATLGKEAAKWFQVPKGKLPKGYQSGTSYAASGWAMVGERGPEMIYFRGGERVMPHGAGGVTYQNITVNTQEINPRLHAAQLGWELARRSSLCLRR